MPHSYPEGVEPGFDENAFFDPTNFSFPAGTHICEIEVDPETGVVEIVKYSAVDDFGRLINPMIVEGQVHGGIAHGVGQALLEGCSYDSEGQLITASYMDYAMPRADNLPRLRKLARHHRTLRKFYLNGAPFRSPGKGDRQVGVRLGVSLFGKMNA